MKRALQGFTLVVALLLVWLATAPFTESGTRQLVQLITRFTPLELTYGGGSLAGELRLSRVALTLPALALRVDDVYTQLDAECLWQSVVCLRQLQAASLHLELPPGDDSAAKEDRGKASDQLLQLPVAVDVALLGLGSARVAWPGGHWEQGALVGSLRLEGSSIDIRHAEAAGARLYIDTSEEQPARTEPLSLPAISLPLALTVGDLRLLRPVFDLGGQQVPLQQLQLQGQWRLSELRLAALGIRHPEWGSLSGEGSLVFDEQWPLTLAVRVDSDRLQAWEQLIGKSLELQFDGDLGRLSVDASATARLETSLQATVNVLDPELAFQGRIVSDWAGDLALGELTDLQSPYADVSLQAPLEVDLGGNLDEQRLQLRALATGLGYQGMAVSADARQQQGRLYLDTVRLQDGEGDNILIASGDVTLSTDLAGSLHIESTGIDLPELGQPVSGRLAGEFTLSGQWADRGWYVALRDTALAGDVNGLPATLSGYLAIDGSRGFLPSNLQGVFNEARFSLEAPEQGGGEAALILDIADLGHWLEGGRGRLQLSADLKSLDGNVAVIGSLSQLGMQGLALQQGEFSGYYRPDLNGAFELSATMDQLSFQETVLEELRLQARGDSRRQTMSLDLKGDYRGRLAVSGEGDGRSWKGTLAPTTLYSPHGDWRLEEAVPLAAMDGEFTLAEHCWSTGGTTICPGRLRIAGRSSGSLRVSGDMDFLAGLLPGDLAIKGDLDIDVSAAWGGQQPLELRGYSRSSDVEIIRQFGGGEQATVSWDRAGVRFEQLAEGLQLDAEVVAQGKPVLGAAMLLPADPENRDMTGNVSFEHLQLATLAPLFPQLSSLEGELHGQIELSGSAESPLGRGVLELRDGRLGLLGNPTQIEALQLQLALEGDRSRVTGSGSLGGGPVRLEGWLVQEPELRLDLEVKGKDHEILLPPSVEMKVSQELQLVATAGLVDVRGEVVVHEGVLRHEQLPEGSVAVSDRVVIVDHEGNVVRESRPFDTRLDLWVRLRDRFKVEGQGLRTTVGGDIHVVQEPERPLQLFGTVNVIGGELEAYRQRLRIQRGTISFAGPPENPELNVRAEREIRRDNVTVGVELTGTVDSPQLTVYSDPVMEHTEAMSFLIRGRGLDAGAAADGTALALSMGASVVNQSGVLDELDRLPFISGVQFGSEGSADDTAATVSGYIGERIYIAYGIGIYEPITVLTARLYFSARLWLEVVSRLENSVDLYYSFEIR